jgi:hypothetical protein
LRKALDVVSFPIVTSSRKHGPDAYYGQPPDEATGT